MRTEGSGLKSDLEKLRFVTDDRPMRKNKRTRFQISPALGRVDWASITKLTSDWASCRAIQREIMLVFSDRPNDAFCPLLKLPEHAYLTITHPSGTSFSLQVQYFVLNKIMITWLLSCFLPNWLTLRFRDRLTE